MNPLRPLARLLSTPHVQTGLALGAAAAIEANQPSLMERPRTDQALVVAGSFASGYVAGSAYTRSVGKLPIASPLATDVAMGVASGAVAAVLGPKVGSSRLASLATTAVRTWSYSSAAAVTTGIARGFVSRAGTRDSKARNAALVLALGALDVVSFMYLRDRISRYATDGRVPPGPGDIAWTLSVGTSVAVTAGSAIMAERTVARSGATVLADRFGGRAAAWLPATHAVFGGALAMTARSGLRHVLAKIEASNSRTEAGYAEAPTVGTVSGSADSVVAFDELGLQGRRFVLEASPGERIDEVMGEAGSMDAIRVYVGVDSAETVEGRIALAIEELERTGAFDRSVLLVGSPAGTGYFNYIPVEAAEYLARGDIASVAIQYGSLPSMLSTSKIPLAVEQHAALLRAISDSVARRKADSRPRVVLYGESLGAQTSQGAFVGGGTDVLEELGIDRGLWAGTPYAGKWRRELFAGGPNVDGSLFGRFATIDEYRSLPDIDRSALRFFFLDHHEDPVTRFGPDVAYRQPAWLGPAGRRPPNVSRTQQWVPAVTFWQTAIDTKNAATVIPGAFNALGHDYRADLAQFVSAAFGLTNVTNEQMANIEAQLRRSEVERAEKIARG